MSDNASCARVTSKVITEENASSSETSPAPEKKEMQMTARVGQKAPDFSAPAYYRGSFTNVSLSDFAGKWVLVCFYPGDFTFV